MLLLADKLYSFEVFLVAFQPGPQWSYFSSLTDILVTTGLVAGEIAGYIVLIKLFPTLAAEPQAAAAQVAAAGSYGETLQLASSTWLNPCCGRPFGL